MPFPQEGADGPSRFETSIYQDGNGCTPSSSQFDGVNKSTSTTPKFEMPFDQDAYGDGFFPPQQFGGVNQPTSNHVEPPRPTFDKRSTAKLLRKLDWNLIPFIAFLYFLALLDSTNIVNVRAVTVLLRPQDEGFGLLLLGRSRAVLSILRRNCNSKQSPS